MLMSVPPTLLTEMSEEDSARCFQAYKEGRVMETTLPASIVVQMLFTNHPKPLLRQDHPPLMYLCYVEENFRNSDGHTMLLTFLLASPDWPTVPPGGPIPEFAFTVTEPSEDN